MIPWPCIHEFLAVVTHPRRYNPATPLEIALRQVEIWCRAPRLSIAGETAFHWTTLRKLVSAGNVLGPAIHDARVAAICLDFDVDVLWTADRDFSRFPALRTTNPLIPPS